MKKVSLTAKVSLVVCGVTVVFLPRSLQCRENLSFAAIRGGEVVGRVEVGLARSEGTVFLVTAFYKGKDLSVPKKKRPSKRAYAELAEPGYLGKYKRWEVLGQSEHYWMLFAFGEKIRVRHEKGEGGKAEVKELGKGGKVVPLDVGMPTLAWLLVVSNKAGGMATCASPLGSSVGKANVAPAGQEKVETWQGQVFEADRLDVTGDCGRFTVWLDQGGKPVILESEAERWERLRP